jgi:hypothetical protein
LGTGTKTGTNYGLLNARIWTLRGRELPGRLLYVMDWRRWIDIDAFSHFSKHTSAAIAAIVSFSIVGGVADYLIRDPTLKTMLHIVEGGLLVITIGVLGYVLLRELGSRGQKLWLPGYMM